MVSSSLDTLLKLSKTTSPNKLFDYKCVTLYVAVIVFICLFTSTVCTTTFSYSNCTAVYTKPLTNKTCPELQNIG